jgi:hypothetical protein
VRAGAQRLIARALAVTLALALPAGAEVRVDKAECLSLPNCQRLSNGTVEVVATTDVGPRVIAYRFAGRENVFRERPGTGPKTEWRSYGGHRLWAAPEARPRTYHPDNDPVDVRVDPRRVVRLTAPVESTTGLQKTIELALDAEGTGVTVRHEITNRGAWPIEVAPWAVTVLEGGGTALVPQEAAQPQPDALLPVRPMALWAYTDMSDARLRFGRRFVRLRSDPELRAPLKIGFGNTLGWAAYLRAGTMFVKRFAHEPAATYPDFGSNLELFTAGGMLEVESLAPLRRLEPGATAVHVERWYLFAGVKPADGDDEMETILRPLVEKAPAPAVP